MFQREVIDYEIDSIDFDDSKIEEVEENSPSYSKYRTNYLLDIKDNNQDSYKILEDNAWLDQKKTIVRPGSLFTGSSFNIPISYYEHNGPYADFVKHIDGQKETSNENDIEFFVKNDDTYDPFENDDDIDEIIEAFNPYVKVKKNLFFI